MNLNALSNEAMLGVSAELLGNPVIEHELAKDSLGQAVHEKIQFAHNSVAEQIKLRAAIDKKLAKLNDRLQVFDFTHDRKARSLHNLLDALAEGTDDADQAALLAEIKTLLFPDALRIVTRAFIEEAGAIVGLECRVTPEVLCALESIRVGSQTLADLYRDWVEAGKSLGQALQERARVQASITRAGSQASTSHARTVRLNWIRAMRLLLDAVEMLPLSDEARESVLAPLVQSVNEALQRRLGTGAGDVAPDNTPDEGMPDYEDDSDLDADTLDAIDASPRDAIDDLDNDDSDDDGDLD